MPGTYGGSGSATPEQGCARSWGIDTSDRGWLGRQERDSCATPASPMYHTKGPKLREGNANLGTIDGLESLTAAGSLPTHSFRAGYFERSQPRCGFLAS